MNKRTLVLIVLALIVSFITFWVLGTNKASAPEGSSTTQNTTTDEATNTEDDTAPSEETANADCPVTTEATITHQNGAFTPSCITVTSGTEISWANADANAIEIGADPHPTHDGNKEITNNEFILEVPAGGQASSTISSSGTYKYHDHTNPGAVGTVIVR